MDELMTKKTLLYGIKILWWKWNKLLGDCKSQFYGLKKRIEAPSFFTKLLMLMGEEIQLQFKDMDMIWLSENLKLKKGTDFLVVTFRSRVFLFWN